MSEELIEMGQITECLNASGMRVLKYQVEMYHKGLNEHKLLSAPDYDILLNKIKVQINNWVEKWERFEEKRLREEEKENSIEEAQLRTTEAQNKLKTIENILLHTLDIDDTVDFDSLKSHDEFTEENPMDQLDDKIKAIEKKAKKDEIKLPQKPNKSSPEFSPKLGFFNKVFFIGKKKKIQQAEEKFNQALKDWEQKCQEINQENEKIKLNAKEEIEKVKKETLLMKNEWEKKKEDFYEKQKKYNDKIEELKNNYFNHDPNSITEYCELVLNNSVYPDSFPKNFELEYNKENKILILEYQLPSLDDMPNIKEVKYIATRNEMKVVYISDSQLNKMYDSALYQIALRTLHELFEADQANAIEAISLNGWVESINKATGKTENICIMSIQAKKDEFNEIELSKVDPKTCFKNLKGVASSKLNTLTPIKPILQINKNDKRIVDGYDVVDSVDNSTNLAAMDWEDFEHLIRELFEKEFKSSGGEVKVTQASRDGGVDAIAFDPDPIRGGKIVIQAKRYTNTVGVAAVRDLYGTVVNEGATKGILVSTADYGPDAYNFAKDKPLTLLNGSNLLHLLEKHGHHAKIDLKEAKKILAENKTNK